MLYWLLYQKLFLYIHAFRIFRYLTFRTAFATLTALLIGLLIGPFLIDRLREFQIGQFIREDGPRDHQKKAGTPTMGGLLICVAILVPTLLWSDLSNPFVWLAILALVGFGGIGFADDYIKIVHKRNLGLTARAKMAAQMGVAALIAIFLLVLHGKGEYSTRLMVPFFKRFRPDLAIGSVRHIPHHLWPLAFAPFVIFTMLVLVFSSNAVNLTDGLDGLAIGCTIIAAGALTLLTYISGNVVFADYLGLQRMPMVSELTIFCGSMVGASIGFLWYNAHPAEVFMGDVGSLALGGAIGTVAVILKQELLLPFIGGVFVLEAVSVILQVGSYKLRKKRIFKMAPIHHHFELMGWSESKVIVRFWIAALVFALFALTTLKLR